MTYLNWDVAASVSFRFCVSENARLGETGRWILRVADAVQPRHHGTDQLHSSAGARDPHAGNGHTHATVSRVHVDDAGGASVHDANDHRTEERRIPGVPQSDQSSDEVRVDDHQHGTILLSRRTSRQRTTSGQSCPVNVNVRRMLRPIGCLNYDRSAMDRGGLSGLDTRSQSRVEVDCCSCSRCVVLNVSNLPLELRLTEC